MLRGVCSSSKSVDNVRGWFDFDKLDRQDETAEVNREQDRHNSCPLLRRGDVDKLSSAAFREFKSMTEYVGNE